MKSSFLFGGNTGVSTPQELAQKRAMLEAMMPRYGDAQYVGEGIGQALTGLVSGIQNRRLDNQEAAGRASGAQAGKSIFARAFGGGGFAEPQQASTETSNVAPQQASWTPFGKSPAAPPNAPASVEGANKSEMQSKIYSGLVERGMPDHVARGAIANLMAESNLNPGINEAKPLVAGSRGGFGLNQWTGPRRREYEAYAQQRGAPLDDLNTQLDFTMYEMQGSERNAWDALQQTKDPIEAAKVYSDKFLRPGIPHMDKRLAYANQLAGMDFGAQNAGVETASLNPQREMMAAAMQGQGAQQARQPMPPSAPPQQMAQMQDPRGSIANPVPAQGGGQFPQAPQMQMAQAQNQPSNAPQPQQQNGGFSVEELISAAQNPWLPEQDRAVVNMLLEQQMQQRDPNYQLDQQIKRNQAQTTAPGYIAPIDGARLGLDQNRFAQDVRNDDRNFGLDERKFEADQANSLDGYLRQVEFDKSQGREPMSPLDYQTMLKQAGAASTNVNVNSGEPSDASLRKKLDENQGEAWAGYLDTAANSAATTGDMQMLDELIKMAPQGPIQGRMAEMLPGFSSAGSAFNSVVKRLAPTLRAPGSGATSDIEYDGMLKSLPALSNKPEANAVISQIMKEKSAINIERGRIVNAYSTGEISAVDARKQMDDLNSKSIMTPEMQRLMSGLDGNKPNQGIPEVGGDINALIDQYAD